MVKQVAQPLFGGRIKKKMCWHCGKQVYSYIKGIDYSEEKDFCSRVCSDAYDRRQYELSEVRERKDHED